MIFIYLLGNKMSARSKWLLDLKQNSNIKENVPVEGTSSADMGIILGGTDDGLVLSPESVSANKENFDINNQISDHVSSEVLSDKTVGTNVTKNDNDRPLNNEKYVWQIVNADEKLKLVRSSNTDDDSVGSESLSEDDDDSLADPNYADKNSSSTSSSSDSESEIDPTVPSTSSDAQITTSDLTLKRGKKRTLNPPEWLKNKAKQLRNSGQAYTNYKTKKQYEKREMRGPCSQKCRLKCSTKINNEQRACFFEKYWQLNNVTRQRDFISRSMQPLRPTYRYTKNEQGRRFNNAFYFEIEGEQIRVCKTFFKNTLGINDRPIRTVIAKKEAGFVTDDFRGKHKNHHHVADEIKEAVREHIKSIPRIESHYLRQQTTREYIEGGKTLTQLYSDYKDECLSKQLPYANLAMYSTIFNTEYNISFFVPKKDQCDFCETYNNSDMQEKEVLEEKYKMHQEEKNCLD